MWATSHMGLLCCPVLELYKERLCYLGEEQEKQGRTWISSDFSGTFLVHIYSLPPCFIRISKLSQQQALEKRGQQLIVTNWSKTNLIYLPDCSTLQQGNPSLLFVTEWKGSKIWRNLAIDLRQDQVYALRQDAAVENMLLQCFGPEVITSVDLSWTVEKFCTFRPLGL